MKAQLSWSKFQILKPKWRIDSYRFLLFFFVVLFEVGLGFAGLTLAEPGGGVDRFGLNSFFVTTIREKPMATDR